MMPLRVLFVVENLARRSGMVLHVRDLAMALARLGHTSIVYSPTRGPVADELRAAMVAVPESLEDIGEAPDIIHGHNHAETMVALLRFPGVPAVATSHGWLSWKNAPPPRFPRILRHIAVDEVCRNRMVLEHGLREREVSVQLNFVDLAQFQPRAPLPPAPARALVFHRKPDVVHLDAIRRACRSRGIVLETMPGDGAGVAEPAALLAGYDLVFAKARSALEGMAVGCAVVIYGPEGLGPLVTTTNFAWLRRLNFGKRVLTAPVSQERVVAELDRYDEGDVREVSARTRREAGLEAAAEALVDVYRNAIAEQRQAPADEDGERRIAATYFEHQSVHQAARLKQEARATLLARLSGQRVAQQRLRARDGRGLAAYRSALRRRRVLLDTLRETAEIERDAARKQEAEWRAERAALQTERRLLRQQLAETQKELRELRAARLRAERDQATLRVRLEALLQSRFFRLWRALAPGRPGRRGDA